MILPRVSIYDFKKIMNSMAILGYIIAASHVFSRALHSFFKISLYWTLLNVYIIMPYHILEIYIRLIFFFVFWHFRSAQKYAYACVNIKNYPIIQYLFQYFWSLYWSYAKKLHLWISFQPTSLLNKGFFF